MHQSEAFKLNFQQTKSEKFYQNIWHKMHPKSSFYDLNFAFSILLYALQSSRMALNDGQRIILWLSFSLISESIFFLPKKVREEEQDNLQAPMIFECVLDDIISIMLRDFGNHLK